MAGKKKKNGQEVSRRTKGKKEKSKDKVEMSVDTSWDIESYRTAYESIEHWELKQEFMEAHKDRFPEARLICLAQVFVNIELLGCKYPDEVMEQVAVLAREVGSQYKEQKKTKLQRTFVKASDAAGAKVKGLRRNN
ncbi:Partner of xrn-2 protein 1 [Chionoecetes opilio]|uniref:Partner of xrn-2 protein 1 n=1 Tax=Chionoecetes opilio TaxID=41210 RepID=A0A8J4XWC5_CHIOP|nr:Partner of xrn-2 protein 1 [Chionoecetes opilio]